MGPCHSSSKKAPLLPPGNPNPPPPEMHQQNQGAQPPQHFEPQPQQEYPPPQQHSPQGFAQENKPNSVDNTPSKFRPESPHVNSSGVKSNNRYGQENIERSNVISKQEPNGNQEVKMGSHFYYSQKEHDSPGKVVERHLDYEENDFKDQPDYRTSLHSNQLNRREIFSEVNKNKFFESRNVGDPDEPPEMVFEDIKVF